MSENSWWVLVCALIAVLLLAAFIIQGLTIRLDERKESGFSCLNAIKVDCNMVGSYHCGQLNEPCCRFYEPEVAVERGNCAFCTEWEFK